MFSQGSSRRRSSRRNRNATPAAPFVGMIGIAAAFFLYGASALVAPWWAVVLLMLVWLAFFVVAAAWWTPHPRRLPWLAVASVALWFVVLVAGGRFLGWS